MAGSRYEYVKKFELPDPLLPSTFFIIRLDGKGFHGFSKSHDFAKPNDTNALTLMNEAAKRVMGGRELNGECVMAFGESDEYSFVFKSSCQLHGRRKSKLVTLVTSIFSSAYVYLWPQYFPNSPLDFAELPVFDGRIVEYVTENEIRDYMRWRQVDTHINNLYNTCFWALVLKGGRTAQEANKELSGTISSQKQEMLHTEFGINYNNESAMFKKGSLIMWETAPVGESNSNPEVSPAPQAESNDSQSASEPATPVKHMRQRKTPAKPKRRLVILHEDFINDEWWETGRGKGVLS
ncbi:tRNA guanylyltransferase [Sporobolomyces salmoneus]|uniref:tRNA guanylyltransferase n=1 Tax=Sporobolomyces salmoneus TaxID=183962 RepID=UPI00316C75F9